MLENLNPDFFEDIRAKNQEESAMPAEIQQLVNPNAQPQPTGPAEGGGTEDLGGGNIAQGGFMPPPAQ